MHLSDLTLRNNLIMAPMAGVTDHIFRKILHNHGAGLTVSEMVSAKSIVYRNKNTFRLMQNEIDAPFSIQFFGSEPEVLAEAIKILDDAVLCGNAPPFDIVDINMGCPMPKIVNNGEGAALMKNPVLAGQLIEAAVRASGRPVTVKIRKGFTNATTNCIHLAMAAEASGASLVTVHGRTRDQYYTGEADWEAIASVKAAVKIPVVGNGDIFTPEIAVRRLKDSGCDGIMIARGAMGNPWLFSRTLEYLQTGSIPPPPTDETIINTAIDHLNAVKNSGGRIEEMRKHIGWYTKGMHGSAEIRRNVNTAKTAEEMEHLLLSLLR